MSSSYTEELRKVVFAHFGNPVSPDWQNPVKFITQDVLEDAHSKSSQYSQMFIDYGLSFEARPVKSMERITKKLQGTRPDVPFKVNSDFCAFRFPTMNIHDITPIMKTLEECFEKNGGKMYVRNSITDEKGSYTDIVQYAFGYMPMIGYIVELQVGHPFTIYTFTQDSLIRDKRDLGLLTEDIVDLWDNGFYESVKDIILHPENKNANVLDKWPGISKNIPIPEELRKLIPV